MEFTLRSNLASFQNMDGPTTSSNLTGVFLGAPPLHRGVCVTLSAVCDLGSWILLAPGAAEEAGLDNAHCDS